MSKLICAKDVEALSAQGIQTIYIDGTTIVTPAARDAAESRNMQFSEETKSDLFDGMECEKVYKVMKVLMERGLLGEIFKPYEAERADCGFKVVRGSTVSMEVLETGQPGTRAYYQEVSGEGRVHTGFLNIEDSQFDWTIECEEHNYVMEGSVSVTVGDKAFTAHAGDVLYFPKGTKVRWDAAGKVRIFYATYPE